MEILTDMIDGKITVRIMFINILQKILRQLFIFFFILLSADMRNMLV